jgi:hypothetical protein
LTLGIIEIQSADRNFFIISKNDAEEQYNNAQDMLNAITEYLLTH